MGMGLVTDKTTQTEWKNPTFALLVAQDGTDYVVLKANPTTRRLEVEFTTALPVVTNATGAAAIATSYAPAAAFWLESVTLHLSAAGTTSENFTVTINTNDGAVYDTVLLSQDLSSGSVVDLVYAPTGGRMLLEAGDAIDIAWPNTETRTYGLRIVARLV